MKSTAKYIRVSSIGQNEERQKDNSMIEYIDKLSGSIPFHERPQAKKLLRDIEEGKIKTLVVQSIDRLGRNAFDVQQTIEILATKNINLRIENLGIESIVNGKQNSTFKMMCDILANVAQMEKDSIRERQLYGINKRKEQGLYKGREKGTKESSEDFLNKHKRHLKFISNPKFSLSELKQMTGLSINTVRKIKSLA
ncbi:recombinase family protein [Flavobacterium sp.]